MKRNKERESKGIFVDNILGDLINIKFMNKLQQYGFEIVRRSTHNSYIVERDEYEEIDIVS